AASDVYTLSLHDALPISPHELVLPLKPAASVLSKSEPGPAFATVDIAFGQPDVDSIYTAKNLKWVLVSSAGFTRYDTDAFRAYRSEEHTSELQSRENLVC